MSQVWYFSFDLLGLGSSSEGILTYIVCLPINVMTCKILSNIQCMIRPANSLNPYLFYGLAGLQPTFSVVIDIDVSGNFN